LSTGIAEFDRVLGGGLVAGQVCLLSGPPGSGKSTLALSIAHEIADRTGRPVRYLTGEESVDQIGVRGQRIGAMAEGLAVADDTDLADVLGHIEAAGPELAFVVVDSVQTITATEVEGRAGGVTQVMAVAQALTRVAKERGLPILLIGQVTKDSTVAGPRALEHIVDTTLSIDGDTHTSLRLLRTVKNRFGGLEVAAFEQTDTGLREVVDPSVLFRSERDIPVPGTCVTVTIEGARALIAEIQALISPGAVTGNPRRAVSGLDSARAAMLIAITSRAAPRPITDRDIYLATIAGIRLDDPATDLAVCLSLHSASTGQKVPLDVAAIGEVTLAGDIRPVPMMAERVAEAARLGYRRLIVPIGTTSRVNGRAGQAELREAGTLDVAIASALGRPAASITTLRPPRR
jgi:DNA repair protein RadA/Sms